MHLQGSRKNLSPWPPFIQLDIAIGFKISSVDAKYFPRGFNHISYEKPHRPVDGNLYHSSLR